MYAIRSYYALVGDTDLSPAGADRTLRPDGERGAEGAGQAAGGDAKFSLAAATRFGIDDICGVYQHGFFGDASHRFFSYNFV